MDLREKKLSPPLLAFYIEVAYQRVGHHRPITIPKGNFKDYLYGELDEQYAKLVNIELAKVGLHMAVMSQHVVVIPDYNFNPITPDALFMDTILNTSSVHFPDNRVVIHNVLRSN